jgi:hypothetical protein
MIFPRTAEIAKPGQLSIRGAVQVVSLEPQTVIESDGTKASSTVGFFPDWNFEGHIGFDRCEAGVVLVDFGVLAELRCALLRQDDGAPFSVAFSGAAGTATSFAIGPAPAMRVGIDVSRRFSPGLAPLVDVYLSSARQSHWVQTGIVNDPVVGPSGDAMGRQEIRLTIPIGLAFVFPDKVHRPMEPGMRDFIVGFEPWFILAQSSHLEVDPVVRSYTTGYGFAFTLGLAFR